MALSQAAQYHDQAHPTRPADVRVDEPALPAPPAHPVETSSLPADVGGAAPLLADEVGDGGGSMQLERERRCIEDPQDLPRVRLESASSAIRVVAEEQHQVRPPTDGL